MSAPHGCTDDKAVVESFKEALIGRVGEDRFRMWFSHGVDVTLGQAANAAAGSGDSDVELPSGSDQAIILCVRGQFALDRLRQNFLREIRGAAMQACGVRMQVELRLEEPAAMQVELPLDESASGHDESSHSESSHDESNCNEATRSESTAVKAPVSAPSRRRQRQRGRRRATSLSNLIADGAGTVRKPAPRRDVETSSRQLELPNLSVDRALTPIGTMASAETSPTVARSSASRPTSADAPPDTSPETSPGTSSGNAANTASPRESHFAMTAANFVAGSSNQLAYTAMSMVCQDPRTASPIFFCGPTGTGKTHMMSAIAEQLRRRHRMRRVMHLSAEQFTNDFISSVGNSGITAFRRRYREVDALLIDDVQFLGSKKATLREMLYTVETLSSVGRPLLFSGLQSPTEIPGLSRELAGRMASGLVCPVLPIDLAIRKVIFRRWLEERCPLEVPEQMIDQLSPVLSGDGRVIRGVVNMINTLQRMYGRMPSMDELRRYGGDLLRASTPVATLSVIETAVCDAFHLPHETLRSRSQTRAVTGPRMLAMYLSRQLTSSAYAEIAKHFGGKSHSTAISAENNVKSWLESGKPIGRGQGALSAQEAIDRVENLLRSG